MKFWGVASTGVFVRRPVLSKTEKSVLFGFPGGIVIRSVYRCGTFGDEYARLPGRFDIEMRWLLRNVPGILLFLDNGIDNGNSRNVYDVAHRTFKVGKVDRLVETHLDGADDFCFLAEHLQHLVG